VEGEDPQSFILFAIGSGSGKSIEMECIYQTCMIPIEPYVQDLGPRNSIDSDMVFGRTKEGKKTCERPTGSAPPGRLDRGLALTTAGRDLPDQRKA
jgi:hypothetical protein